MTFALVPAVEEYWKTLSLALPEFSAEDRRVAVAVYRELAKGEPLDATIVEGHPALDPFVYRDPGGRISGFGGLAVTPMHHQIVVDGRVLWTWCALDALFIPGILGTRVRVRSPDPITGNVVQLVVTPDAIEVADPADAVMSFLLPGAGDFGTSAANVMARFCHFVFLFGSPVSAGNWRLTHEGTFCYGINDAFAIARRMNIRIFGDALFLA